MRSNYLKNDEYLRENYYVPIIFEIEFEKVWIPHGDRWKYIPKFNTFWYRDYVSDCPVVRATLKELEHFQQREEFSSEYRFFDESILYKHLSVLCTFTD